MFTSCNDDSADEEAEVIYGSTQVKGFSLKANANVLSALDSVFFSIDLVNAQIFNADSLPFGTRVDKLVVQITTDACSKVELNVPRKNAADTVVNYLTNSTDSIDFSNGPVRLHLVSYDGKAERDYTIKVNVHKMEPDLLYWNKPAMRRLPTDIDAPRMQKSVRWGDTVACLTGDGMHYNIAVTENPYDGDWTVKYVDFGFTPRVESLAAAGGKLFILSDDGYLYSSADGQTWSTDGDIWYNIIGNYQDRLLGVINISTGFYVTEYPGQVSTAIPVGFPVDGMSQVCELSSRWTSRPQVVMLGGRTVSGELTNAVWGYDGKQWAKISDNFPKGVADAAMFDYRVAQTDTLSWVSKEVPVLIAMCGEDADGLNKKVYVSRNSGLDWKEGDDLLQLPDYIEPREGAQAIVVNRMTAADGAAVSRSASREWMEYAPKRLPQWWMVADSGMAVRSRAVAPVTEWEVPYIYLFGGYDAAGHLYDSVWRGVINRLSFKPLQ